MNLSFSRIIEVEAANLEEPFTEEEVKAVLTEINGDKAPGPDGFTTAPSQSLSMGAQLVISRALED